MKVAFVSQLDPADVLQWSGTPYNMVQALKARGHQVKAIGPLKPCLPRLSKLIQRIYPKLFGRYLDLSRHRAFAHALSEQAKRDLAGESFDLVLCSSSLVAAGLEIDQPIVTWEDATFASMLNYYPGHWCNLSQSTIDSAHLLQRQSLDRAQLSVFASHWAAQSAICDYGCDPAKVVVIPLGANIAELPNLLVVRDAITQRAASGECRLLFLGVDWVRKGGDLVVETATLLNSRGIKTRVDVVGCLPDGPVPEFVTVHGFVSKRSAEGRDRLNQLMLAAHYLFVPSLAECYGLVYAEASALGVPSLARDTGGVGTVVRDGINGRTFPMDAPARAYADFIADQMSDGETYTQAALQARRFYEQSLNWDAAIAQLEAEVSRRLDRTEAA
ncbi:glycosyltransferase family 4 protein [Roseateles koreensis]|uniref:Glycosyltransferase family 4 protein n=1 Tax=Roseateles koreensis TaxID=2987526 RepID=A0ABT5KXZ7_9BURK|nr:glycosyltransferase family 4 protein [Roseateles koreensis]MDC8786696.1 glycosyltransferase family 4 protein [Roseateles koreensis]